MGPEMSITLLVLLAGQVGPGQAPQRPLPPRTLAARPVTTTRLAQAADAPQLPPEPVAAPTPVPPSAPVKVHAETWAPPQAVEVAAVEVVDAPLMAGGISPGGGCPTCPTGLDEDEDDCVCKLGSTCDMFPHYAYYPRLHGYYYFRPYNYTAIAEHQQTAACMGLDPRMPYSLANFQRIDSTFPRQFTPQQSPLGSALPQGSGLPELESLVEPKVGPAE